MSGRDVDRRRFGLLDAMILIAAAAVGMVGVRDLLVGDSGVALGLAVAELALMLASGSILLARLRRPRPPLRRVASQPGAVACSLPVAVIAANDAGWLVRSWLERRAGEIGPIGERIWLAFELPDRRWACVVPVGWMVLLVARRWCPEPGWIDRSGRAIGWGWVAWGIAGASLE